MSWGAGVEIAGDLVRRIVLHARLRGGHLPCRDDIPFSAFLLGGAIGLLAAPAIDIAVLSTEEVEAPAARDSRPLLPRVRAVVPMVSADRVGLAMIGEL